jgi:ribosomal protein S4
MLKPKYKVCFQTKKNIWKNSKIFKNFKRIKWAFINLKKKKDYKHYSLKQKDVFLSKYYLIKGIHTSSKNVHRRKIKLFFSHKRSQRNYYYFNSKVKIRKKFSFKKFSSFRFYFKNYKNQKFFNKKFLHKNLYRINLNKNRSFRKSLGKVSLKQFKKISYSFFGFKPLFKSYNNKNNHDFFLFQKRLDYFLNNLQISFSILHLRNLINYGFFIVNNKIIKSPNYFLKTGDVVSFNFYKSNMVFKEILWKIFKKPYFYKKNLSNFSSEINWNTLSVFVL